MSSEIDGTASWDRLDVILGEMKNAVLFLFLHKQIIDHLDEGEIYYEKCVDYRDHENCDDHEKLKQEIGVFFEHPRMPNVKLSRYTRQLAKQNRKLPHLTSSNRQFLGMWQQRQWN